MINLEDHTHFSPAADVPFVLRIVVQGLLPGLPPNLSVEAQNLSANLNASIHGIDQSATGLIELCPACRVEVPLVDITNALCTNGHAWGMFPLADFSSDTIV
jgi:general transcription factor 3C polypeptide 4